jgi:cyclophilin family peptidyl-prolyl cis-trans isomerase
MPESRRRTRDRNLAKHAARRQMERMRAARRRRLAVWSAGIAALVAIALVGGAATGLIFGGEDDKAGATPTPSTSTSPTPSPSAAPGTRTGTVTPGPPQATTVACGAEAPATAGKSKPQFAGPPPLTIDEQTTYLATIKTSCGTIVIQLDAKRAPKTVNSFVFLAQKHFFDGMYFHRLVHSTDVIQAGDPVGSGSGGPGYSIPDELKGKITYKTGTLAMAKGGTPNSGGSQFFIIAGPGGMKLDKNPDYTIFGRVVSGLDVAKRIHSFQPEGVEDSFPTKIIYIDSLRIRVR